jgi:hypothetical protein
VSGSGGAWRSLASAAAIALLAVPSCAPAGAPRATPPELTQAREWRFLAAEHVALWYHGLAHTGTPASDAARELPLYDPAYVPYTVAERRTRELETTALETAAGEFATAFRAADSYRQLELLPLYFADQTSFDSGVRVWAQAGGDPRRAGSAEAANVVALLSGLFPQARQRDVIGRWLGVLADEETAFHRSLWQERRPQLEAIATAAGQEWQLLAGELQPLLAYLGLPGGDVFIVPALRDEGRLLLRGAGRPRIAVGVELAAAMEIRTADNGGERGGDAARLVVYRFLRELVTPLAGEAAREYLAPARVRQIGEELIVQRAAVRATALVLDAVSAEHGTEFRRAYVDHTGAGIPEGGLTALEQAFRRAYPLPPELERGLANVMRNALAGI